MAAFFAMGLLAQSPATALAGDADDYDVQAQVQEQEQAQLQESFDISYEDVGAAWKNFRNSDVNMAITNANTPTSSNTGKFLWAFKLKDSSMWNQPNIPIIVDNYLITTGGTKIYKLDLATGQTVASGSMVRATDWGYTSLTYAEGMIFAPIKGGVQAFSAKTLESLWVYTYDATSQSVSPITYNDGCIYTGWWKSETKDADFACIDISDTDPSSSTEVNEPVWSITVPGGFYWAGSVVVGDHVIVGTDNGNNEGDNTGTSHVYSLDKKTGKITSDIEVIDKGDIRSSMAYDAGSGRIYFTSKAAYVCMLDIDASTGVLSNFASTHLADTDGVNLASTSTPVVYGGRVFVGAGSPVLGGKGGPSDAFFILDADSLETLDKLELNGECKASPLLSTVHESEGYLYFYVTYNANPGGIEVVKVPADKKSREFAEVETLYDAKGYEQYCIASPICGTDGTLYYRNDSSSLIAVGEAAKAPSIDSDLAYWCNAYLGEPCTLSIEASAQDSSSLSYQWYSSSDNATYTAIEGATGSSYAYIPSETGSQWFYCTVTATKGAGTGETTAQTSSQKCVVDTDGYVDIEFSNTTYSTVDGAKWNGSKAARVFLSSIDYGSPNAMALIEDASERLIGNLEYDDAGITAFDGIAAGDAGASSKWVAFIDDWAVADNLSSYVVGDGTLESGSHITMRYSVDGASDIGIGDGTDKSLSGLDVEVLTLAPAFSSDKTSYEAIMAPGTIAAKVSATAADKAFQVKMAVGDASGAGKTSTYPNGATIPVFDGQTITVTCGDPSWPTTAKGSASIPAKSYTIKVKAASASISLSQPEFANVTTGKIHADEVESQQVTVENTGNVTLEGLWLSKNVSEAFEVFELGTSRLEPGQKTTVTVSTVEGTPAKKNLNNADPIPYEGAITVSATGNVGSADNAGITVSQTCEFTVAVDGIDWVRLEGTGRIETGASIVEEGFDSTGGTVIVTTAWNFPDALCASGLAGALDEDGSGVPVILVGDTRVDDCVVKQLGRLKPSKVIIVGGEAAVSSELEWRIAGLAGCPAERIAGNDRYDTSNKIYEYGKEHGTWSNTAIVATGMNYADALSASPYAYASKSPILLVDGSGTLPTEASQIVQGSSFENVLIAGGNSVVSQEVETVAQIGSGKLVQRLSGDQRDDTSIQIAKWATGVMTSAAFKPSATLSYDKMAIATAWNYPDALAGASMCGKNKAVAMLMVDNEDGAEKLADEVMSSEKAGVNTAYILGGTGAISNETMNHLKSLL